MKKSKSLINILTSKSLNIEPCGIPSTIFVRSLNVEPILILCVLVCDLLDNLTHWYVILFMKRAHFLYFGLTCAHFSLSGKDLVFNALFTYIVTVFKTKSHSLKKEIWNFARKRYFNVSIIYDFLWSL